MRRFHHVGVITDRVQPGEIYVAQTKVHVTNPAHHPYRVEYLRFEPDSPVTGPVRDRPHMAFVVEDLEAEIAGEQVRRCRDWSRRPVPRAPRRRSRAPWH